MAGACLSLQNQTKIRSLFQCLAHMLTVCNKLVCNLEPQAPEPRSHLKPEHSGAARAAAGTQS